MSKRLITTTLVAVVAVLGVGAYFGTTAQADSPTGHGYVEEGSIGEGGYRVTVDSSKPVSEQVADIARASGLTEAQVREQYPFLEQRPSVPDPVKP